MYSDLFKEKGIKNTKHRYNVLEVLEAYIHPISADKIYEDLLSKKVDINLSTVYRVLELFCEKEILQKVLILDEKKYLYELNRNTHKHYLVCTGCKDRIEINHCPLHDLEDELMKKTKYKIAGHKLDVYGCCPQCQEDEKC